MSLLTRAYIGRLDTTIKLSALVSTLLSQQGRS
jgi:hypothetical protein